MTRPIKPQELSALITRLEEEYGEAKMPQIESVWDVCRSADGLCTTCENKLSFDEADDKLLTSAVNSMPTLLAALKHYMAVAEVGERLYEEIKDAVVETGYEFPALTAYRQALDTPSN